MSTTLQLDFRVSTVLNTRQMPLPFTLWWPSNGQYVIQLSLTGLLCAWIKSVFNQPTIMCSSVNLRAQIHTFSCPVLVALIVFLRAWMLWSQTALLACCTGKAANKGVECYCKILPNCWCLCMPWCIFTKQSVHIQDMTHILSVHFYCANA